MLVGAVGTGKTQLAVQQARAAWTEQRVDVLVWIDAASRSAVVSAYAETYGDLTGESADDPERAARAFLAWLRPDGAGASCRWLVVLDGVVDPADLSGLWPPHDRPNGHCVVTTRRRDTAREASGRRLVTVPAFTPEESAAQLVDLLSAHGHDEDPQQAAALAEELGRSPLALSQAAAHLVSHGTDCAGYRRQLADDTVPPSRLMPDAGALPDGQTAGLHELWPRLIERAARSETGVAVRPLLALVSLFDSEGLLEALLTSASAQVYIDEHRTVPRPAGLDYQRQVPAALELLDRHGLLERRIVGGHRVIRCDRFLQRVLRGTTPGREAAELARTALGCLDWGRADGAMDAEKARLLYANLLALLRHHEELLLGTPSPAAEPPPAGRSTMDSFFGEGSGQHSGVHHVMFAVPRLLGEQGDAEAARNHFAWLAAVSLQRHGPVAPSTLAARSEAAHWRGVAGDAAGAVAALADVVAAQRAVTGDAVSRHTALKRLAQWRGEAGDPAGAVAVLAELLDEQRRYGGAHPADPHGRQELFTTRRDLARWRGEAGDPAGAATALGELLRDQLRELHQQAARPGLPHEDPLVHPLHGPDHLGIFPTHSQQAYWLGQSGDAARAAAELGHLLAEQRRVLGPDHPDTLATQQSLAHWRSRL